MAEFSVLIIGAGTKGATGPVSHAEAFTEAGFNIVGFLDASPHKAEAAAQTWGGQAFSDIGSAFAALGPVDVTVVSTPDSTHYEVLYKLIGRPTRFIFAEKPFTRYSGHAKELLQSFVSFGQSVMVNYTRRFSAAFMHLQAEITNNGLGNFLGGAGFYGKGLYHNGSHMLDLLLMLFSDVQAIQSLDKINDGNPEDPSVSALLECNGKPFYLGILPRTSINAFEATLYFERAAIRITDCGRKIDFSPAISRYDFPEEQIYGPATEYNSSAEPMAVAVQNIFQHLKSGDALLSPAENAVKVLELCEALS